MPVRRYMDLTIGPNGVEPLDVLEAVFREHRRQFDDSSWAAHYFEKGVDVRGGDENPCEVGLPGLVATARRRRA